MRCTRAVTVVTLAAVAGLGAVGAPPAGAVPSSFTPAPGSPRSLGGYPADGAVGDFDGDGVADLAITIAGADTVSVLLGAGDGSFGSALTHATGDGPRAIAAGDFDADSVPDLAVTNFQDGTVTVLLGDGDGTFTTAATPVVGSAPVAIAVGDFDRNGAQDLAVASYSAASVSVVPGNGDGTFGPAAALATGGGPSSLVVRDFNSDSSPDLAVAEYATDTISLLAGNGDGTFAPRSPQVSVPGPQRLVVSDFDRDGRRDLAINSNLVPGGIAPSRRTIRVALGGGGGTFGSAYEVATTGDPTLAAGDVDRDGNPDLVTSYGRELRVVRGNGDGGFADDSPARANGSASAVLIADFDRDGYPDLASPETFPDGVSVLLNDGPPLVTGGGATNGAHANSFGVRAFATRGRLSYIGSTRRFDGTVRCTRVVDNAATIVAVDATAGRANRTMVQDNGGTGDKLVNTAFTLAALSPRVRERYLTCVTPDIARLSAAPALSGGSAVDVLSP